MNSDDDYRDYDEGNGNAIAVALVWVLLVAITVGVSIALSSCTTTQYVPVETVRTEYREADTTKIYDRLSRVFEAMYGRESRADSLVDKYTEKITLNENGDTTRHDKERIIYRATHREQELERTVYRQDSIIESLQATLENVKSDSVQVPNPVEKKLSRWEQTKMDFGGMALGGLTFAVVILLVWVARKPIVTLLNRINLNRP